MRIESRATETFGWIAMALLTAIALAAIARDDADPEGRYAVQKLVSDQAGVAAHQDPNLVNAWGIAFNPFGFVWVSNAETGKSTLYDGAGVPQSLVVTIPPAAGGTTGSPTGIVFNGANTFLVTAAANSFARFIFATEDGVIAAWAPTVNPTNAILVKDNSSTGAQYKGLALSAGGNGQLLYATDFHNGKIDVWDSGFNPVTLPPGAFADPIHSGGLRAVRYPGDQRQHLRDLCQAGRRPARRCRGQGPGLRQRVRSQRQAHRPHRVERPAQRSMGPGARARRDSANSAAACSSPTSATDASTPTIS